MSKLDFILILIIFAFGFFNFWFGFVHAVGSFVGIFLGAWLAGIYYDVLGMWLLKYIHNPSMAKVVGFIIIYVVVNRGMGLIFSVVDHIFHLPLLNGINRIAGAILGLVEGVLVVGLVIYVLSRFSISDRVTTVLTNSDVAHWLITLASVLSPLLPEWLYTLKSSI